MSADLPRRRGFLRTLAVAALLVVAGLAFGGWWFDGRTNPEQGPRLSTTSASRGPYEFTVTEVGSVENAASIELKCEVKSRGGGGGERGGGGGVTIISVVPEGSHVEPGDIVVELDAS